MSRWVTTTTDLNTVVVITPLSALYFRRAPCIVLRRAKMASLDTSAVHGIRSPTAPRSWSGSSERERLVNENTRVVSTVPNRLYIFYLLLISAKLSITALINVSTLSSTACLDRRFPQAFIKSFPSSFWSPELMMTLSRPSTRRCRLIDTGGRKAIACCKVRTRLIWNPQSGKVERRKDCKCLAIGAGYTY